MGYRRYGVKNRSRKATEKFGVFDELFRPIFKTRSVLSCSLNCRAFVLEHREYGVSSWERVRVCFRYGVDLEVSFPETMFRCAGCRLEFGEAEEFQEPPETH